MKFPEQKICCNPPAKSETRLCHVSDELSTFHSQNNLSYDFYGVSGESQHARILIRSFICGNSAGFEAPMERREDQNSIDFDLIGQYTKVCATNR